MASADPNLEPEGHNAPFLARPRAFLKHNNAVWPAVAFALLIVAGVIVLWNDPDCTTRMKLDEYSRTTTVLLLLWIAWIYAWVIHCFSGDPYANRSRSIEFAYFFVILSFVAVSIMVANIGRASSFGVVEGCVTSADDASFLPIRCDYPLRLPQAVTRTAELVPDKGVAAGGAAPQPGANAAGGGGKPAAAGAAPKQAGLAAAPAQPGALPAATVVVPGSASHTLSFSDRMLNAAFNHNYHHLLNIGGRLDLIPFPAGEKMSRDNCPAKMIQGGVPVPVYFVLLALIGAAISLARNVPVIQRRSDDGYVGTAVEPRLAPGEVRELLAFQILQFVSAPFLAVAAYHTLKPESLATTVALGFLTGFASEKILSMLSIRIKDVKEKTETATVAAGSISGDVRSGGKPVAGATVEIEGFDKVKPVKTDADGRFTLVAVPVNSQPYRLRAGYTDKDGSLSGARAVSLAKPTELNAGTIELGKDHAG